MRIKMVFTRPCYGLLLVLLYHFFQKPFLEASLGNRYFLHLLRIFDYSALDRWVARRKQGSTIWHSWLTRFYRIVPPLVFMVLVVMPLYLLWSNGTTWLVLGLNCGGLGFVTNFFEMATGGSYESNFIPASLPSYLEFGSRGALLCALGTLAWFLAKRAKTVGKYRYALPGIQRALSFTFLSMFIRPFWQLIPTIYFPHSHFPFFAGSCLATVTGIANVSPNFTKLVQSWSMKDLVQSWVEALPSCFVLSLFLPFDSPWTYLFGFLQRQSQACAMILSDRILHERTPDKKEPAILNFLADTSYGVYFSTGLSLSSSLNGWEIWWQPLWRRSFPLVLTGSVLLYFGANHCRQEPRVLVWRWISAFWPSQSFTSWFH